MSEREKMGMREGFDDDLGCPSEDMIGEANVV